MIGLSSLHLRAKTCDFACVIVFESGLLLKSDSAMLRLTDDVALVQGLDLESYMFNI